MTETVYCQHLKREGEALPRAPLPGELGQRIQQNICREAWQKWLAHQTLLINEKRLSPIDPEHRKYLMEQAEGFLFGGDFDRADGYVPPE